MYKAKICNFISGLLSIVIAIITFILVNNGTIAITEISTPLIISIAFSGITILTITYILSQFNLFSNQKESYCLCKDIRTIIFSSLVTFILGLVILLISTLLTPLTAGILLGITSVTLILTLTSFVCITFCLTSHLCHKEYICYNFCNTQDN